MSRDRVVRIVNVGFSIAALLWLLVAVSAVAWKVLR